MRLTIGNLFMSGRMKGERKRSATILARKPSELNPPSADACDAAGAGYKVGGREVARWQRVVPAKAGTHYPRREFLRKSSGGVQNNHSPWLWAPAFAGATAKIHTAILRCRTGAPTVRDSAASMMALASMPYWR